MQGRVRLVPRRVQGCETASITDAHRRSIADAHRRSIADADRRSITDADRRSITDGYTNARRNAGS